MKRTRKLVSPHPSFPSWFIPLGLSSNSHAPPSCRRRHLPILSQLGCQRGCLVAAPATASRRRLERLLSLLFLHIYPINILNIKSSSFIILRIKLNSTLFQQSIDIIWGISSSPIYDRICSFVELFFSSLRHRVGN